MFDKTQNSYISLRDCVAERTSSILAWVGSGVSADAGLPTWNSLKRSLVEALKNKGRSLEPDEAEGIFALASSIEAQKNNWVAFEMLHKGLGKATYVDTIREVFRPTATSQPPALYELIWKLNVRGILNLNLDRLATKSFIDVNTGRNFIEFDGARAGNLTHVLRSTDSFITNLHGNLDDASSWVFSKPELSWLLGQEAYKSFIRSCLSSHTVIFVGVSADDIAVGGHLELLTKLSIDVGSHFWITDRRDAETDRWAEKNNLRLIRYSSHGPDHSELYDLINDMLLFVPREGPLAPPVVPANVANPTVVLPPAADLLRQDAESIRQMLNSQAQKILSSSNENYDEYEKFNEDYDEAIYRAWYLSTAPGKNNILGYTILEEVAQGAFGKVYRARGKDDAQVAIKILLEDIRKDPSLLQCFRRGVRSMRILAENKVLGMVAYKEATEIPALVVMDWIEGPNLGDAVQTGLLDEWESILKIAVQFSGIIKRAHQIPERVLHRDLRPSNIMLENFYIKKDDWTVVVLDFDLSWHRGALEKSVMHSSGLWGYLAPEQITRMPNVSTRHAGVDSFGTGMVFYYMISKMDPLPAQHRHEGWQHTVFAAANKKPCIQWRSVPARFARAIANSTLDSQSERWDMTQINNEVARLYEAILSPDKVSSAELIAEELASRCSAMLDYEWERNKSCAKKNSSSGSIIEIVGNEADHTVDLDISWSHTGSGEWRKISKYLESRTRISVDALKKDGWKVLRDDVNASMYAVNIKASIDATIVRSSFKDVADTIDSIASNFRF